MRKVLFFIAALTLIIGTSFTTTKRFTQKISVNAPLSDSVFYPTSNNEDVIGSYWSVTVTSENLSAPIVLNFGGTNIDIDNVKSTYRYHFSGVPADSLPYTFDPTSSYLKDTTDGVAIVERHFVSDRMWLSPNYGTRITTTTDTVFTLELNWVFYKP